MFIILHVCYEHWLNYFPWLSESVSSRSRIKLSILHALISVRLMLSLGTNQLRKHPHNNQRISGFQLCDRFVLFFFPSLPLLLRNRWYLSKQPALGSWLMGPSSWTSLHLVQPHLLQIANKKCFYLLYLEEKGGLCEMRWDEVGREEEEDEKSWTNHTSFSCNILWCLQSPSGLAPEKKEWSSRAFSFALLHYSL